METPNKTARIRLVQTTDAQAPGLGTAAVHEDDKPPVLAPLIRALRRNWIAGAVLVSGVLLSIAVCLQVREQVQAQLRATFDAEVTRDFDVIQRRMEHRRELVLGLQGLMNSAEIVPRESFRRYISNIQLEERFPAVFFVYYAQRVALADKDGFEKSVRRDTSLETEGYPGFAINPPGDRPEYYVMKYVEPTRSNANILGIDAISRPALKDSVYKSRDTGEMTASGDFELQSDPAHRQGFTLRAPIYRKGVPLANAEQRRAAITGLVGATMISADLVNELVHDFPAQHLRLRIFDVKPGDTATQPSPAATPIFDSLAKTAAADGDVDPASVEHRTLNLADRHWELLYSPAPGLVSTTDYILPLAILIGGLGGSLLLFALIISMANRHARAERVAQHMTRDLRRSEERFRSLADLSADWYWEQDAKFRFTKLSESFFDRSGMRPEQLLGRQPWEALPTAEGNPMWLQHRQKLESHLPFRSLEYRADDASGRPRWFSVSGNPIFDNAGKFTGYRGTGREITRRKQTEVELDKSLSVLRATLEATADAILVVDDAGEITSYNRKYVDLWHMPETLMRAGATERRLAVEVQQLNRADSYVERIGEVYSLPDNESFDLLDFKDGRIVERYSQPQRISGRCVGRVWSLRDVTQRMQAEHRLAMQHAVARLLAGSQSQTEVMSGIVQAICETLDWQCGMRWSMQAEGSRLKCEEIWHVENERIAQFAIASRSQVFEPGPVGFIRKAVVHGSPVWKSDVASDATLDRARAAAVAGLRGAFAFPILDRGKVLGVLEFYSTQVRPPDTTLLEVSTAMGSQIGQFLRRKTAEDDLQFVASHDILTGLPNRSLINQRLDHALAQAKRSKKQLGIMFVDLDRFKTINDSQGHAAGDAVLRQVAARLSSCLRATDTIARQGGDEFVILIEDINEPQYFAGVAEKLLATLTKPFVLNGIEYHLGASIGVSTYPGDCEDAETLFRNADIAMYRAKDQGRNNFQFYSAQMNTHSIERLRLESDLRHALERNELVLYYQPKVDTSSRRINGVEVLLRWQHPERGLVLPHQFIEMAEETGLILPIGNWVLRTACERVASWLKNGVKPIRIAVNLSPRQFANQALTAVVADALADAGLAAEYLELEITESMVMQNPEQAVHTLNEFKKMGLHLSIDDFGIGYSSLSYLKRFPIDSLKIDRSFVKDLPHNTDDAAITRAIIAMAQSLKLKTIAEGVETDAQLAFLEQYGCNEIQGFFFSVPLAEAALLEFLKTW
jgi:diguanylate cyclase (GGDEF)-like protein/PAS domain S-box-containing protein